ncbi:MAG: gamma-glutamyl-gamma-aminobutyrate hydrolase family protein [bacterium]|nr:gamma-glutamyl-gamma-aminobutyrate hydrolase family protein [bacterium]
MSNWLESLPDGSILLADIHSGPEEPWKHHPSHPLWPYSPEFASDRALGWFLESLGEEARRVFTHWDMTETAPPGDLRRFKGIVMTGSFGSANDTEPWREVVKAWYRDVVRRQHRVPFLGICGGHQLVAVALGGTVGPNPNGKPEMGTRTVWFAPHRELKGATHHDPLFVGIASKAGDSFDTNFSHREQVTTLPEGAIELAHNMVGPQAYRLSDHPTWGVQWQPEARAAALRRIVEQRNLRHLAQIIDDTPAGLRLLTNFLQYCADGGPLAHAGGVT